MPLHPQLPIPERILTFGDAGSGKTTNWLNIAKWLRRTQSPSTIYVADTDFAVPRMLSNTPTLAPHIKLYPCYDWSDYSTFAKDVSRFAKPTDWVIIDFITNAWQAVQSYYTEEVFKKTIGNYFIQARKELESSGGGKSLGALEGWTDWSVINAVYKQWVQPLLFKGGYHIYATAKSAQLSSDKRPTEDQNIRQIFLRYGVRPDGQKDLPYQFHTVLLTGYTAKSNRRTITTVKDRERPELSGKPVTNFAIDYLKEIAGWQLA